MTSQEQTIQRREANARKWAARQARWAAWKAKQAKNTFLFTGINNGSTIQHIL